MHSVSKAKPSLGVSLNPPVSNNAVSYMRYQPNIYYVHIALGARSPTLGIRAGFRRIYLELTVASYTLFLTGRRRL